LVPLQKHVASGTGRCKLRVFKLFLRQYAYCPEHNSFEAVPAMPAQIPVLLCDALEALQAISQGTLHSQAISHGALDLQAISHGALDLQAISQGTLHLQAIGQGTLHSQAIRWC